MDGLDVVQIQVQKKKKKLKKKKVLSIKEKIAIQALISLCTDGVGFTMKERRDLYYWKRLETINWKRYQSMVHICRQTYTYYVCK